MQIWCFFAIQHFFEIANVEKLSNFNTKNYFFFLLFLWKKNLIYLKDWKMILVQVLKIFLKIQFPSLRPSITEIWSWDMLKKGIKRGGFEKQRAAQRAIGSKQLRNLTWEDNLFIAAPRVKSRCHKNTFHTGSLCVLFPTFFLFLAEDSFSQFFLLDSIFLAWLIFELTHIYLLSARLWPLFVAMLSRFYLCSDRLLQFVSRLMLHFLFS